MSVLEKNKQHNLNYQLSLSKLQLEMKLQQLQKERKDLMKIVDRSIRRLKYTFLGLTIFQFGFFYHCIFNIEWLGWDIMEPITYSVEVVKFLGLLRFFYTYQRDGDMEGIYNVMINHYCNKYPIVGNRLRYIEKRIQEIEAQLFVIYDYDFIQN
jgi:hypothetical protein